MQRNRLGISKYLDTTMYLKSRQFLGALTGRFVLPHFFLKIG